MKHKYQMNQCEGCGKRYPRNRKSGQFQDKCKKCARKEGKDE